MAQIALAIKPYGLSSSISLRIRLMANTQRVLYMFGVDDGNRTHDNRSHNPGLYQLSYAHHKKSAT